MITRDLFELASLDVLGLLDDDERREFERAFRAAPASVQAQVRREQLRAAHAVQSDEWLPNVDTPIGLKGRVVTSVRDAIVAARAGELSEHVSRKIGFFTLALQRNVSPLWRAACIGLLTASAVLGVALVRQSQQYDGIREAIAGDAAVKAIAEQYGARFAGILTDPASQFRSFNAVHADASGVQARLVVDEGGANAFLVCNFLPQRDDGYRLVVLDANGQVEREVSRFSHGGGVSIRELALQGLTTATLAIIPGSGPMTADRALLVTA